MVFCDHFSTVQLNITLNNKIIEKEVILSLYKATWFFCDSPFKRATNNKKANSFTYNINITKNNNKIRKNAYTIIYHKLTLL